MISLAALEAYVTYAKDAQSNGLSIDDIEKAMTDQGVDDYSRSLVLNQLKDGQTQPGKTEVTGKGEVAKKKRLSHEQMVNIVIYVVAVIEPLGVIPQIYTIFSRQNAAGIAVLTWILFVIFDLVWLWYGWESKQKPLIVSSIIYTALEGLVVVGAILYGGHW